MIQKTREIVIELLSQLGSSREAREYLRKFNSAGSYQFAVIKVGGDIVKNDLQELAHSIAFLQHVGLYPIVLHGAGTQLNDALTDAGIETQKIDGIRVTTEEVMAVARPVFYQQNLKLVEALENLGIRSRGILHGVFECDYADREKFGLVGNVLDVRLDGIKSAIESGALPVVSCLGETQSGQMLNVNADIAAAQLVLAIQPYKIIFLTPTGGLLDDRDQVISAINLETDYPRLARADWVHSGMRLKLEQIKSLLDELPLSSSVSITSAGNLTRELFTHLGAGTLIRRGEGFVECRGIDFDEQGVMKGLIRQCFGRQLSSSYFDQQEIANVIWATSRRAAAVFFDGADDIAYMDKFAVTPDAQGEGVGAALWQQVLQRYDRLYWRSRNDNPVNAWYMKQSDFDVRHGDWRVFGYGIHDFDVIEQLVKDAGNRQAYWEPETPS